MSAISRLCSRALLLQRGRLDFDGPTLDAVTRYLAEDQRPDALRWETAGLARRLEEYGELARLTVVEVRPASAERPGFHFGEDLRLSLTFVATTDIHHAAIGVGIDDLFGARIATFNSDESGVTLMAGRDRTYTFDLRVPRPVLNPGRYAVSCAVMSGARILDFLPQAGYFDVQPIRVDTGEHFEPTAGAGPVRLACTWDIQAGTSAAAQPVAAASIP